MLGSREEKVALKAMWHDAKRYLPTMGHMPPWRNWLARSAVNRKVGGSSPPGGANILFFFVERTESGLSNITCLRGAIG